MKNTCTLKFTVLELRRALDNPLWHTSHFILWMEKLRLRGGVCALEIRVPEAHPNALCPLCLKLSLHSKNRLCPLGWTWVHSEETWKYCSSRDVSMPSSSAYVVRNRLPKCLAHFSWGGLIHLGPHLVNYLLYETKCLLSWFRRPTVSSQSPGEKSRQKLRDRWVQLRELTVLLFLETVGGLFCCCFCFFLFSPEWPKFSRTCLMAGKVASILPGLKRKKKTHSTQAVWYVPRRQWP